MEMKTSFICIFLIVLLIAPFFFFRKKDLQSMDSEIYEIDYRGPETHNFFYTFLHQKDQGKTQLSSSKHVKHHRKFPKRLES
ncbi:hypothetical protein P3S67_015237 [Capsicum chacoense]